MKGRVESRYVEENSKIARSFGYNQTHRSLKVSQASSAQQAKLIRLFGQFSGQSASLAMSM